MNRTIVGLTTIAALLIFSSCKQTKKNGFQVDVSYRNADKLNPLHNSQPVKLYLQEIAYGKDQAPVVLDSTTLSANAGKANLTGSIKSEGIYELVFGDNILPVPLINDAQEIKVNVDLAKRDDYYQVEGSPASKQLQDLISTYTKKNYEIEKSFADLDSLKRSNAPDSITLAATKTKNNAIDDLNIFLKHFVGTTSNGTLGVLALGWATRSLPASDFEASLNDLQKRFPDNIILKNMAARFRMQKDQQAAIEQKQKDNSWVGKEAPDLSLPDVNGKKISLSSFRGKYLLVDFWASWCGPCREENPNVVRAYNEFRNKNFTIVGVSIDKDKEAWKKAIADDKLAWTHISDLKYWSSQAVETFKFEGIPYNILIDPQGKIIGESLRGPDLENKLKELFSNPNAESK